MAEAHGPAFEPGDGQSMNWEYKSIKMATHTTFAGGKLDEASFDKALNDLGGQGWELVAVFPLSQTIGETRDVVAAFKRQLGL